MFLFLLSKLIALKVEALLNKTQSGMPGSKVAKVDDHEAFLTGTAALLHPSNFQVRGVCIVLSDVDSLDARW